MITVYCPRCYAANAEQAKSCSLCGAVLAPRREDDYTVGLIWALQHPEPTVAPRAAWILGERRDRCAVMPLIELAGRTRDLGAMEEAVTALGKIGDPAAVQALAEALRSSYLTVRVRAAEALGRIGGAEAAAALRDALADTNRSVRDAAALALETAARRTERA